MAMSLASAAGCTVPIAPLTISSRSTLRALEPQLARHDAGDVEQLVDELRLPLRAVEDRLGRAVARASGSRPRRSMSAHPRIEFSGVRSSCMTTARN